MADQITYSDKSNSQTISAPANQKVSASDMNEIKTVVNTNATETDANTAARGKEFLVVAASDETTDLTTGTDKTTFRIPYAATITEVRASLTSAPTGADLVVDINKNGATILSTKLSIDATEKTSTTATTPAVISDTAVVDDDEFSIDIDQIGSTVAGTGLKVTIISTRS